MTARGKAIRRPRSAAPKRAIGYIRVSEMGGRSGPGLHTLDLQRESIERACRERSIELVDVLTEINRSGADPGRPVFREAMSYIETGRADSFVVWKVSRFSRDLGQARIDADTIMDAGGALIAGDEPFDTSGLQGDLMLNLLFVFADYERKVLNEQWEKIKTRVIDRGTHLGRTPIGYLRAKPTPKLATDVSMADAAKLLAAWGSERTPVSGGLVPHPVQAPAVQRAFEARAEGNASFTDIARLLDDLCPRTDGRLWSVTHVRRMLVNRTYLGEATQGERTNRDAHEPLVTHGLFKEAQSDVRGYQRRSATPFLLNGLVYCAGCSHKMTGGHQGRSGEVRVYRCQPRRNAGVCQAPAVILADRIEQVVADDAHPRLEEIMLNLTHQQNPEVARLDDLIALAGDRIDELESLDAAAQYGSEWIPTIAKLRRERDELVDRRDMILTTAQEDVTAAWDDMQPDDQRNALRDSLGAVFVRRAPRGTSPHDRTFIFWVGEPLPPVSRRTASIPITPFEFPAGGDLDGGAGEAA